MIARWLALGAATVAAAWGLDRAGVPSPYLFAALLVGLVVALVRPRVFEPPPASVLAAQAVLGVVLGAYLQSSSLEAVGDAWLPVAIISAATLALCTLAGAALRRTTALDGPTATLGMVAGGASGIVAMTDELGGDDRLVAFMQYARVLIVVLTTPLIAALLFPSATGTGGDGPAVPFLGGFDDWALTLLCAPAGAVLGRAVRLPAGTLLGPMLLAGSLTLTEPLGRFAVPGVLQEAAFVVIGLQVGLRFTVETVREVGRLLGPVLLAIGGLIVGSFGLAVALEAMTDVTLLDAYLATTPGGLYAVLAVSFGAGADTTFILAVQSLRLFVMVLLAPLVVRRMVRATGPVTSAGSAPR